MKIDFSNRELQTMIDVLTKHTISVEKNYKDHIDKNGGFTREYLDDLEILHTLQSRFTTYQNWHKDDALSKVEALKELGKMLTLELNWDGYNGEPPSAFTIAYAKTLLDKLKLDKLNDVYPDPNGSICLYFLRNNDKIEISVYEDKLTWYIDSKHKTVKYYDHLHNDETINILNSQLKDLGENAKGETI